MHPPGRFSSGAPSWPSLLAAVALAGAAEAQTATQPLPAARPALDLSRLRTPFTAPYVAPDAQARASDIPKTAIERRLSADGLTGSLGYLCGIDSSTHELEPRGGPASSFGRESTFLGAKLSYAFR